MKRESIFTPGKAGLFLLGVGTLALAGVPGYGTYLAPEGSIAGIVRTVDGETLEDVEVALFDGGRLSLVEIAYTDDHGRFAFSWAPSEFELLATSPRDDLAPAWADRDALALHAGEVDLEFTLALPAARPETVSVVDAHGNPIEGAEVRVLSGGPDPAVLERVLTDTNGSARVRRPLGPEDALLAVLAPNAGAEHWLAWSSTIVLPKAPRHVGRVVDEDGQPIADLTVSAWSDDAAADGRTEGFQGWTPTDEDGRFVLACASTATLRITDPAGRFAPASHELDPADDGPLELGLTRGRRLEVSVVRSVESDAPLRADVRVLTGEVWSHRVRTDAEGRARFRVPLDAHPSVIAVPVGSEPAANALTTWDAPATRRELQLAPPRADKTP